MRRHRCQPSIAHASADMLAGCRGRYFDESTLPFCRTYASPDVEEPLPEGRPSSTPASAPSPAHRPTSPEQAHQRDDADSSGGVEREDVAVRPPMPVALPRQPKGDVDMRSGLGLVVESGDAIRCSTELPSPSSPTPPEKPAIEQSVDVPSAIDFSDCRHQTPNLN